MGPEYGDIASGWQVDHAVTRSVRDSARLLDATAGPAPGDPYCAPPPARPFAAEVGADPGRLRIAFTPRTPDGTLGHPDCIAALDDAVALCTALGHDVVEADLPGLGDQEGAAIGTVFNSATAWVVRYWVERIGREPEPGELDPLTAAYNEMGSRLTAGEYLLAIERLQRLGRGVAGFLAPDDGFDAFLTPTMSEPPAPLGEMVSTADEPLRSMERSSQTVRYAGVVANITGNPAMSVPLWWNASGLPIGVHFLGRFGDEATLFRLASQLESARPWTDRLPPTHATTA
jgi:amidase